jgi:hypothetical protein
MMNNRPVALIPAPRTTTEWMNLAPLEVRQLFDSVPLLNALRDIRNRSFQSIGAYDGAITKDVKQLYQRDYDTLTYMLMAAKEFSCCIPESPTQ